MSKNLIIIKNISTSQWKAQSSSVDLCDNHNTIKGDNGVGKSTLAKAWSWLLTSYTDAMSSKNSNLFDDSVATSPDTPVASVSATVKCLDGKWHKIERTAKSKWTRKRGTGEYEKDKSDEYNTFVDEVEYSARDFDAWVSQNICDTNVLRYCLSGDFFLVGAMDDKKKMREFLSTVVGDVSDDELTGDYSALFPLLQDSNIDIIVKQYKALVKNTEERQKEIPALIDAEQSNISSYDQSYDFQEIESEIAIVDAKIKNIDGQLLGNADALKPFIEKRNAAIKEKNRRKETLEMSRKYYNETNAKMRYELEQALAKAQRENGNVEQRNQQKDAERKFKEQQLEAAKKELNTCIDIRKKLKERQAEIKERIFTEDKCAYCGQTLPEEALNEARERFNKQKDEENKLVIKQGKANNNNIQMYEERINTLKEELAVPVEYDTPKDLSELQENIAAFDNSTPKFEDMEECQRLIDAINEVVVPDIPKQNNEALTAEKQELMDRLKDLNRQLGVKDIRMKCVERVEKLRIEQKNIAASIAEYEKVLIQAKRYSQEKMEIISSRVNEHLEYASVQMFSTLKDGSTVDDLIIKDKNGISYGTTNGASRILMAVDIQRFFCEKNDVQMPIWIDEASIINPKHLKHLDGQQVIKLMYADCPLTVEYK